MFVAYHAISERGRLLSTSVDCCDENACCYFFGGCVLIFPRMKRFSSRACFVRWMIVGRRVVGRRIFCSYFGNEHSILSHELLYLRLLLFDGLEQVICAVGHLLDVLFVGCCCDGDITELLFEVFVVVFGCFFLLDVGCAFESVPSSSCLGVPFGVDVQFAKIAA